MGFAATGAVADRAGVVVRPDVLSIPFAVRVIAADAKAGTAVLEEAVRKLDPRFAELAPKRAAMQLRMRGIEVETKTPTSKAKSDEKEKRPTVCVILEGVIVYTLDSAQTYWDRSHQIAKVADVSEEIGRLSHAETAPYVVTFGKPELHASDPEARRGELTARWAARRKDFAREAKAADLAVALDGCKAPGEIVERVLSLEEIELTLPVECRPANAK